MPLYCDIALPVPLDMAFTYAIPPGMELIVGGRALVPFRQRRMSGIVVALHDRAPQAENGSVKLKAVIEPLDSSPVLDDQLLKLGKWIAEYYLAPLGEVFRTMLPLSAEFKRAVRYRITDEGHMALHLAGMSGSSARSQRTPEDQLVEVRVLDYLAERDGNEVNETRLRAATHASRPLLSGMIRKKWIAREDVSASRDATRTVKIAALVRAEPEAFAEPGSNASAAPVVLARPRSSPKLNDNQRTLIDTLAAAGGQIPVETLRALDVPHSTLSTLVRRGFVNLVDEPQTFALSKIKPRPSPFEFQFTPAQREALIKIRESVAAHKFTGVLLHGVTGSGKTAVYLAGMREVLEQGRSSILLVPEIGLTPAVAADLHQAFGDEVSILHSALTHAERAEQWHRIKRGEARVVVGTRSAVFAPVSDLALVIVDEEQDSSYKQEETPRYHARDVAVMRAKMAEAVVVLGSATPSLESYYNARKNKYALVELPDRVENRPLPEVEIIDMRQEFQETGHDHVISRKLAEEIRERLDKKEQVMVLLNRRGYSPVALCRSCGQPLQCSNCAVSMTHHKREHKMQCHYCGFISAVPKKCAHCGSEYVHFVGTGSEKLEELLHGMFPQARIGRLDRDTVRGREDFERALNALNEGELDILVGTQMIAKGHDVHGVTLVGVVGADAALGLPDFRAAERTFQLLTQVAGRAGRGQSPGKVVLQTFSPDHYAVQFAARHDFAGFYDKELQFRSWMHYPPYSAIANIIIRSEKLDEALTWSGELGRWFEKTRHESIRVLGPAAAPILRLKRDYRYHFILKSPSREKMNTLLRAMLAEAAARKIPRTQVIVDVDALWLM